MTEKGEEMGGGGGEGYGFIRKKRKKTGFGSNLGKGRRLPIPNIPGDEWENWCAVLSSFYEWHEWASKCTWHQDTFPVLLSPGNNVVLKGVFLPLGN